MISMMPTRYEKANTNSSQYKVHPVSPAYHAQNHYHPKNPSGYTPENTPRDERPPITYNSRGQINSSELPGKDWNEAELTKYQRRENSNNPRGKVSILA